MNLEETMDLRNKNTKVLAIVSHTVMALFLLMVFISKKRFNTETFSSVLMYVGFLLIVNSTKKSQKKIQSEISNEGNFLFSVSKGAIDFNYFYAFFPIVSMIWIISLINDGHTSEIGTIKMIILVFFALCISGILILLVVRDNKTKVLMFENIIDMRVVIVRYDDIKKYQFVKYRKGNYSFEFNTGKLYANITIKEEYKCMLEKILNK